MRVVNVVENVISLEIFCENFDCFEVFFEDYYSISKIHKKSDWRCCFSKKIAEKCMRQIPFTVNLQPRGVFSALSNSYDRNFYGNS